MLKFNEKTEVLVISTPYRTDRLHEIGDIGVQVGESACNLCVIFDNNLDMSNHIKTVWHHLHN